MEPQQLLDELENVATRLDIAVRYEEGDFNGGLCRVKSDNLIIINKNHSIDKKITTLARELSAMDLSTIYILPRLRERIYNESAAHQKT